MGHGRVGTSGKRHVDSAVGAKPTSPSVSVRPGQLHTPCAALWSSIRLRPGCRNRRSCSGNSGSITTHSSSLTSHSFRRTRVTPPPQSLGSREVGSGQATCGAQDGRAVSIQCFEPMSTHPPGLHAMFRSRNRPIHVMTRHQGLNRGHHQTTARPACHGRRWGARVTGPAATEQGGGGRTSGRHMGRPAARGTGPVETSMGGMTSIDAMTRPWSPTSWAKC